MAFVAGQAFVNRLFARREVGRTTALGRKPALPERAKPAALDVLHAYGRLLKLRIVLMVLISCAIGLVLASGGHVVAAVVGWTLLGTALLAGGACALNQYQERELDARMERTRHRPLPAGLLDPRRALVFSIALLVAGGALLAWRVNLLTALLGFLTALLYNFVYTPMKRRTWLNTPMGAIPGAIPPMMGWAAATGRLDAGAWLLFVMVFLWQHVHFYAIAWLFRDDYRRAGFRMLPTV
jgi:protoheme IX farnesyltransferase